MALSDDWNHTTRGLASIYKEGVDSIDTALRELEAVGYIIRSQLHDQRGRMSETESIIYEQPQRETKLDMANPSTAPPCTESPCTENLYTAEPYKENLAQINTNRINTHLSSTQVSLIQEINPYQSNLVPTLAVAGGQPNESMDGLGWDGKESETGNKYRKPACRFSATTIF